MKKKILGLITVVIICILAVSMFACSNINAVLEVRFGEYNIWQERILPEVLEFDMKKGETVVGSLVMSVDLANENKVHHVTKLGITEEKQEIDDSYTFTTTPKSFVLTQSLKLNDGSYSMETVSYMTSTYMVLGSYTKIVNNGQEKIIVSKNIDEDRYYYTKFENGSSVSEKIKLDKYRLEAYYDNTLFYFVLRSIPHEYAGFGFKLIDTDNADTYKVTTTMDTSNETYDIVSAKTTHKVLGDYKEVKCYVQKDEYRKILKIVEGEYTYELKA